MSVLAINDVHASVEGTEILKGLSLNIGAGEVHAIMGPNGAGKSTLSKVILGHDAYEVDGGSIALNGEDLDELDTNERANKGLFVGFQYPVEVPGVNNEEFLRLAYNAKRAANDLAEVSADEFAAIVRKKLEETNTDPMFLERDLNSGFSGGQKKRNEILQMFVLEPQVAILDETDSGLDIDALRVVADGINAYRGGDRAIILITHYQRLLDLVKPDHVHVLAAGKIVKSGGPELAHELEAQGYDHLLEAN